MYNNKRFLAIIPARRGSKGLKDKNIKRLCGKPMIFYTIEAAKNSGIFDDIIVSTDSQLYADISIEYGASVPLLRPEHLSTDTATTNDVIEYTIKKLRELDMEYDYFMILQPTSPLRKTEDIIGAVNLLFEKKANSIISVCESEHSPLYANILDSSLSMDSFLPKDIKSRRQELPKYYRLNGAIYLSKVDYFLQYKDLYRHKSYAYIMDKQRSIDIDDDIDFFLAENLMKLIK
ncbi:acylneuraminate cytidylyltransferase family protein [Alkaliphilus sp. MSJ-5]|uniref:Acylneuraminate cytidylyltransferase family protein n=1 Tax=Alkaliphilus flagellatus TaxID=2841507 RepID=A0ABS6G4P8_9FIRM|nr:acylneuraminate cytidylyltransferase family protein [Alkaliphilus flagellatus]MBU5676667.1 acylneuraminate cytidylyltransferase family protein [Alkaliphilus flagellatus]